MRLQACSEKPSSLSLSPTLAKPPDLETSLGVVGGFPPEDFSASPDGLVIVEEDELPWTEAVGTMVVRARGG